MAYLHEISEFKKKIRLTLYVNKFRKIYYMVIQIVLIISMDLKMICKK